MRPFDDSGDNLHTLKNPDVIPPSGDSLEGKYLLYSVSVLVVSYPLRIVPEQNLSSYSVSLIVSVEFPPGSTMVDFTPSNSLYNYSTEKLMNGAIAGIGPVSYHNITLDNRSFTNHMPRRPNHYNVGGGGSGVEQQLQQQQQHHHHQSQYQKEAQFNTLQFPKVRYNVSFTLH